MVFNEYRVMTEEYDLGKPNQYFIQEYRDVRSFWEKITWRFRKGAGDGKGWRVVSNKVFTDAAIMYEIEQYDSMEEAIDALKKFGVCRSREFRYINR